MKHMKDTVILYFRGMHQVSTNLEAIDTAKKISGTFVLFLKNHQQFRTNAVQD